MKGSQLNMTLALASALVAGAVGFWAQRAGGHRAPIASTLQIDGARRVLVPRAQGNIALDGDLDDPGWQPASVRTQGFVGPDGVTPSRPYSEARIVWSDDYLYLGLYAADEDLRARSTEHDALAPDDDVFNVVFNDGRIERVIDVSPAGVIRDGTRPSGSPDPLDLRWECNAKVSVERDGTLNDPRNHDEEWVIEMAIPFESLGLRGQKGEAIGVSFRRCDTTRNGATTCGTWGIPAMSDLDRGDRKERVVLVLD